MSSPYLSDDCIYCILKYLQDDRSTLFNCLLVNRLWCRETVPLLYKNPFNQLSYEYNKKSKIIFTFILCFNKAEILRFKNQLNQYNININDVNINDIINKPLFEYSKYIEYYDYLEDHGIVREFILTFHQSNLRKSINIKQSIISFQCDYQDYNIKSIPQNFSNLKSLSLCDINLKPNKGEVLLKSITNNCLNLRKLEFSKGSQIPIRIKKIISTIIQKQNKLEAFKIFIRYSLLSYIFSSLEFQKHSLVYIEFVAISFQLTIKSNIWNDKVTSSIIKYLGESLQKLYFHGDLTILIIEYLSLYCLNLNNLKITIDPEIVFSLIPYFKNLRIRNFYSVFSDFQYTIFGFKHTFLLEAFFENLPHHFETISLNINIHSEYLKIILNYIKKENNSLKFFGMGKLERVLNDEETKLLDQIRARGVSLIYSSSIYHECTPITYNLI
ncbi:hypothetical protein GLOIN_2v1785264 [Rhizophagus irregularis DAOM 181602=DAOM 197198]|uniref:F-box domain-containing protein n=1 Tax=Rhizophagus irregularis (strain DAOM 181602 / DAOM 197198 / MUCL 43194) TaxID=747089 RepID=A0A2P4PAT2_RHIID|nr:hypothetical protein GLOIN_2v1785264 [Rhizophagus irregularis DAOM 181602=DAOM 197198]POG62475.1 hypothetical protein GLOIN_2v1785264 [Rhizophagus irregularis DAOM 181602=DAOM 197198]|eukprot:XP_025169341.1 hypothetical protein GLOIN_2v1785264 [Rhizophagus irregularis DAOM 181602=DAOM 197198]